MTTRTTDPDVPRLQKMLTALQRSVARKQLTPAMASGALGTYANTLKYRRHKKPTRRASTPESRATARTAARRVNWRPHYPVGGANV